MSIIPFRLQRQPVGVAVVESQVGPGSKLGETTAVAEVNAPLSSIRLDAQKDRKDSESPKKIANSYKNRHFSVIWVGPTVLWKLSGLLSILMYNYRRGRIIPIGAVRRRALPRFWAVWWVWQAVCLVFRGQPT
jgi:hypothetical protein